MSTNNDNDIILTGSASNDSITNFGNNVTINGGAGADSIDNRGNNVSIVGGAGDDSIDNAGDNVTIDGGAGADYVYNSSYGSLTVIDGGDGDDYISNYGNSSTIKGGTGVDSIYNAASLTTIDAGEDNDSIINGAAEQVTISGGEGDDFVYNSEYSSLTAIDGGDGDDYIYNNGNTSTIKGGTGVDSIYNAASLTTIDAGEDNDSIINGVAEQVTISGGAGDDFVYNSEYSSLTEIDGGDGDDYIYNNGNTSTIKVGTGVDSIYDDAGLTAIDGGDGDDYIINYNYGNRSTIKGGTGNDSIYNYVSLTAIDAGDGDDYISIFNYGNRSTIKVGTGNDLIYNYASLTAIDAGDGDDYISIFNYGNRSTIKGGTGNDSIYNYVSLTAIDAGDGDDYISIYDYASLTAIDGGDGNDTIVNGAEQVTISGGAGDDSVYNDYDGSLTAIDGGDGNDTIVNGAEQVTISGGAGDDSVYNDYDGSLTAIDGGDGNDTINNRASQVTIKGGTGVDSIYNYASLTAIDAGDGDDNIYNRGNISTISGGEDNDSIDNRADNVSIFGGSGNDVIVNYGDNSTLNGGTGNNILTGSRYKEIFQYGGGNDTITNYSGEDIIHIAQGKIDSYSFDGGDLIFHIGNGSLRLKNMTNHAITVRDSTGKTATQIYSNGYSQQQVIKNFVKSQMNTALDTNQRIDVAVQACSHFNSLQEVIDQMVADCKTANNADTFLRDYCGIITDNADTGAIIGWDMGGLSMLTKEELYPTVGEAKYPTNTTFTIRGLNITVPEKSTLTEKEQLVVRGLYSWWAEDAIKLIEESYGVKFNGQPIELSFFNDPNAFAWGRAWSSGVEVNMGSSFFTADDKTGNGLNGLFTHELTHVMQGIFNIWSCTANYMDEGMADMTDGGYESLNALAGDSSLLAKYLDVNNTFSSDRNVYAAGYMFWYYLAKQSSDYYDSLASYAWKDNSNIVGTSAGELLTGNGENQTLSGGGGNDTITAYGKNSRINGDNGNDYIAIGESAENLTIFGGVGADSIINNASKVVLDGGAGNDSVMSIGDNVKVYGGDGNDTITAYGTNSKVNGDTGDDYIAIGDTAKNLTIIGGKGNDYIKSYSANGVVYQYSAGDGKDTITGSYGFNEKDTIQIAGSYSTAVSNYFDVLIKVGDGSILLRYANNKKLNIVTVKGFDSNDTVDSNTVTGTSGSNSIINTISGATVDALGGNDTVTNSASNVSINAGAGNDYIENSGSHVTILGGKGNDNIVSRKGGTVYQYSSGDGNDTITGYNTNDSLQISGSYDATRSGNDVIVSVGTGTMLLSNFTADTLNINSVIVTIGGNDVDETVTLPTGLSIKKDVLTASTKFIGNNIDLAQFDVDKVNASSLNIPVEIIGDTSDNSIKAGKGDDTLRGGSGNDTLTGGNGNDVFIHSSGNDLITDYKEGEDSIRLTSGSITTSSLQGSDVILYNGNSSITLKKAKDKKLTVTDSSGNTTTKVYDNGFSYAAPPAGLTYDKDKVKLTAGSKFVGDQIDLAEFVPTVTKVNAASATNPVEIIGNDSDNSIKGGKESDTIRGGNGNNTLTGGKGNDIFVHGKGNDIITDYKVDEDKIQLTSGTVTDSELNGKDVILYNGDTSITVKKGKDKTIALIDGNGNINYRVYDNGFSYSAPPTGLTYDKNKVKLTANSKFEGDTIDLSEYISTVTKIDASKLQAPVDIIGNDSDNSIKGGKSDDTLRGGLGNDTLKGGDGKDIFVHESGNDVISDYKEGEDSIKLTTGTVTDSSLKGSDVILYNGDTSILVKKGKDKLITVTDSSGNTTSKFYGRMSYNADKTVAKVAPEFKGTLMASEYDLNVVTIDASNGTKAVTIYGNDNDNEILGGKKADAILGGMGDDTLNGGKGNDTLTGGDGNDVFVYASGDGKDVITDYRSGDVIKLTNATVKKTTYSDNDAILKIGSGSITVKDGKNQTIVVNDATGNSTLWFADDNNFVTNSAQIDSITNIGNIGQVNVNTNYDLTPNTALDLTIYESLEQYTYRK